MLKTSDFDYNLPEHLIAQTPAEKRDMSRLMVVDRKTSRIEHRMFKDVIYYLVPGDILVINDTKVLPANIIGRKADGTAKIEVLLVSKAKDDFWTCLVKPGKRLKIGSEIIFSDDLKGKVMEKLESGEQVIEFTGDVYGFMHEKGEVPLPPYINMKERRKSKVESRALEERYQTVYADKEGASAAPTAGLHFTPELLKEIENKGIKIVKVTLHTGLGTFKPVYAEYIKDHKMFDEEYDVSAETIKAVKEAKRVVAVGTTSVRTLETLSTDIITDKRMGNIKGSTDIFIYPGYEFKVVDMMITNFQKSTLMMLVSAFAGKELIFKAYQEAIEGGYRFFSFGDAMLIL
jgi:S-adenosylmethionine:tRNA ribosyltransferase-isomerase